MAFGKLVVDLMLKDKGFQDGLKKAGVSTKQFEGGALKLSSAISGTLVTALKVGTAAVVAFGAAATKIGTDFQHSITLVKTLSKDGIENFRALEDEARRLGATTEFSARQSADAMINFARAGMSAREIIAATGPALMMAGGAGESMSLATMSMAASLRQFSLDANQAGHVADVFTVALKRSLFNLQGLNDAMKYAGPAGAVFGMSIEETTAAVAQFRNMGLDASMAGTAFRMSMVALAKQTPAMTKVLKKYNIATEKVSVTNLGFEKVLINLAEAGVTAEDAIKMFGARAGANMGLLIQQMQDPAIRDGYKELTADLYASSQGAGAAKIQYEEMGKTVKRQFLIAKSALEELMITTFDTYKGDLQEFLKALGGVIQSTADTFRGLGIAGSGMNSMLQDGAKWLRENRAEIAAMFIDAFTGVQRIIAVINALMPLVRMLSTLFLYMFPAAALASFSMGIASLIVGFKGLAAAASAAQLAMASTVGVVGVIAAGVGLYVAALVKLDSVLSSTTDQAAAFQRQLKKVQDQQNFGASRVSKAADENLEQQKKNFANHAKWMKQQGQTEAAIERYRQRLEALTGASASSGVEQGRLIEVQKNGVTEYHNLETAAMLMGDEGIGPLNDKILSASTATLDSVEQFRRLQAQIQIVSGEEGEFTGVLKKRGMTQEHLKNVMNAGGETIGDWRAQLVLAEKAMTRNTDAIDLAEKSLNDYRLMLLKIKEGGFIDMGFGTPKKKTGGGGQSRRKQAKELLKIKKDLEEKLTLETLDGEEKRAFIMERSNEKIAEKFDALIKRYGTRRRNASKRDALEKQKQAAIFANDALALQKRMIEEEAAQEKQQEADRKARAKLIADNEGIFQSEKFQAEADARLAHYKILHDIETLSVHATAEDRKRIDERAQEEITAGAVADVKERMEEENRIFMTSTERMHLIRVQNSLADEKSVKAQRAAIKAKYAGAIISEEDYQWKLSSITDKIERRDYTFRIQTFRAFLDRKEQAELAEVQPAQTKLSKYREAIEKELAKSRWGKVRDLLQHLTSSEKPVATLVESMTGLDPEKQKELIEKLKKFVGVVNKYMIGPLKAMASKAVNIFKSVSGFSFDMGSMIDEAAGKKGEMGDAAVEAAAARRDEAGRDPMTDKQEAAIRGQAEGKYDPAKAAAEVADEQAKKQMEQIQMWIDMVPTLIKRLAANLPPLIRAFVAAVPEVMTAVVEALSGPAGLLMVIARAIPDLMSAIIEAIPGLIPPMLTALIEFIKVGIPQIVQSLADALPEIVQGFAEALPGLIDAIFSMIPQVIESIIGMLPVLLPALVLLVMNLVTGIIEMIPQLIIGVVEAIPLLITALAESIPGLVEQVIAGLPRMISAIIMALPQIFMAIIASYPAIMGALLQMLPNIMKGIIKLIPGILTALFVDLPKRIWHAITEGWDRAWGSIQKAFKNLFNPSSWFSDTPGPVQVGNKGAMLGFGPNDYIVAAKKPIDLLQQVLTGLPKSTTGGIPSALRSGRGKQARSRMMASPVPLSAALPQMSAQPSFQSNIALKVQIEGETIDNALITSKGRGTSPQIWGEIQRISGVKTGFDRG
jgi:TP901 family phage tail tape measure protein